ncbi:hypothetical protein CYLTODRAFT_494717 [Cylindrobasidium torrendii FP15055 ss-10]|uniref:Casein kinase substrate phosphoprotein PP28 domain-containing protein n=1 Tax=Cylindrobasidium torrendii FP15055 ss-10 TaxID=1314674 RepID=A0A0D7AWG0_9AGAR|nr:hypothetical protein CYLTODRAFT_494717 [Cylindrobasidium torrendii FP15055 ss-10]
MVRGTGKFKQKRGGGRNFSKDMVLDESGTAVSAARMRSEQESDDESSEEEEEEEEESEEEEAAPGQPELTRTERRDLKKKQAAEKAKAKAAGDEDDEDEDLINPNHVTKKLNISSLNAPREMSRKEREAKEKQDAKDRYWKLHVAGKTDEAKSDLSRLAKIRAERAEAEAKRKAETEAKNAEVAAKSQAQREKRK